MHLLNAAQCEGLVGKTSLYMFLNIYYSLFRDQFWQLSHPGGRVAAADQSQARTAAGWPIGALLGPVLSTPRWRQAPGWRHHRAGHCSGRTGKRGLQTLSRLRAFEIIYIYYHLRINRQKTNFGFRFDKDLYILPFVHPLLLCTYQEENHGYLFRQCGFVETQSDRYLDMYGSRYSSFQYVDQVVSVGPRNRWCGGVSPIWCHLPAVVPS